MAFTPGQRIILIIPESARTHVAPATRRKYHRRTGVVVSESDIGMPGTIYTVDLDAGNGHDADCAVLSGSNWLHPLPDVPTFTSIEQAEQWLEERAHDD
jgi:hypothetical protein